MSKNQIKDQKNETKVNEDANKNPGTTGMENLGKNQKPDGKFETQHESGKSDTRKKTS